MNSAVEMKMPHDFWDETGFRRQQLIEWIPRTEMRVVEVVERANNEKETREKRNG